MIRKRRQPVSVICWLGYPRRIMRPRESIVAAAEADSAEAVVSVWPVEEMMKRRRQTRMRPLDRTLCERSLPAAMVWEIRTDSAGAGVEIQAAVAWADLIWDRALWIGRMTPNIMSF